MIPSFYDKFLLYSGQPIEYNKFESVTENLKAQGAEIILLGCTELSFIKKEKKIGKEFLDMLEVLAKKVVLFLAFDSQLLR